jgi:hypothetical protein
MGWDLGVDERIIWIWRLQKYDKRVWIGFTWKILMGYWEQCDEFSRYINSGKIVHQLNDYWLLKKDFATWRYLQLMCLTGCLRRNSGVLVTNIYSLLWHKKILINKTIKQSLQVLLSFSAFWYENHWRPYRRRTTFHLTPHLRAHIHRNRSDSCCNPSAQIGKIALLEEAGSKNSVRRDAAPHVDHGVVANMLHWGLWVPTAPNPATVAVYNTMCVKSSFVEDKTEWFPLSFSPNLLRRGAAISLEFMSLKLRRILN